MTVATWYAVSPLLGHKWVILPATGPSTVDNAELRDLLEKALREGRNALLPVLCSLKWGLIHLNGENGIVTVYEDGHVRSMDGVLLTIKATLGNLALRGCLEHTGWSYSRRSLISLSGHTPHPSDSGCKVLLKIIELGAAWLQEAPVFNRPLSLGPSWPAVVRTRVMATLWRNRATFIGKQDVMHPGTSRIGSSTSNLS